MNAKLNIGDTVSYNGVKTTVLVSKKNFATNQILYKLEGEMEFVSEEDLITPTAPAKVKASKETNMDLSVLKAEYLGLIGKPVPANKGKNAEWIAAKIKEAKGEEEDDTITFASLQEMTREQLVGVIDANELDLDLNDYDTDEELVQAICEELEIEIPAE